MTLELKITQRGKALDAGTAPDPISQHHNRTKLHWHSQHIIRKRQAFLYYYFQLWKLQIKMREIVHVQAGQCGNQIGSKVGDICCSFILIWWWWCWLDLIKWNGFKRCTKSYERIYLLTNIIVTDHAWYCHTEVSVTDHSNRPYSLV